MPLTVFQSELAKALAINRTPEMHLAGGAAILIEPNSIRFSNDLDYFNDSDEHVAKAFEADERVLKESLFTVKIEMKQPGYIRAQVSKNGETTKVEWAFDSAWRFMPTVKHELYGYLLHPIDLAVNKVLTLAGRNEPRDFLDILFLNESTLPLGALCWAAVGKDPGFNPQSLLELLKRRGKFRESDFLRLNLKEKINLENLKSKWLLALADAEEFIKNRHPDEAGCLYYSSKQKKFISPSSNAIKGKDYELHFGRLGGLLPRVQTEE